MISLTSVTRIYNGKRQVAALESVDLEIARGEMVSIVGPSGSGKSTLLNLIGGLDRPTSGEIRIDGQSVAGLSDDDLTRLRRDKIGFIFQFFNLLPSLSCLENVALPLHLKGLGRQEIDRRARQLLELVQLTNRLDHLPDELSGGERQRVTIAQALACRPALIVADEPFTSLDAPRVVELAALFRRLRDQCGTSFLLIGHHAGILAAIADRLLVLRAGALANGEIHAR